MKISVQKIALIGIFTALSLIIFMVEAQFPVMPIGGMKLGLANIVTMTAMLFIGRKEAGLVLLLRIILAAGLYGTVVSFAFSLTGGILAYLAMCIAVSRNFKIIVIFIFYIINISIYIINFTLSH